MSGTRLKIHLDRHCLLSATSRIANASPLFQDDMDEALRHDTHRLLSALLDPGTARAIEETAIFGERSLRISFVECTDLTLRRTESGTLILTDGRSWSLPFDQVTLGDVLAGTGLLRYVSIPAAVNEPGAGKQENS